MGVRLELEDLPPRYREQAERQIAERRDYIYRRRLFIDLVAEPRGWKFTEWYADKED